MDSSRVASVVGTLLLIGAALLSMQTLKLADGTSCGTWVGYKVSEHERFEVTARVRRELAESFRERGDSKGASRSERAARKLDAQDFACGNAANERSFFVAILGIAGGAVLIGKRLNL